MIMMKVVFVWLKYVILIVVVCYWNCAVKGIKVDRWMMIVIFMYDSVWNY